MKRAMMAALILLIALPVAAAEKWTRVQSKNFTLVGNATENEIREVAEGLEVFRSAFSRFFKLKEGSSIATTVFVFRSDQAFKPYKPVYQGKPANIGGYFQSSSDMNYIALAADMQTPRVIYHEYIHRLMADNMASLPLWFQEGFAECFSSMEIVGKDRKVRLGRAIAEHVELLNNRNFMPLENLFAVQHGSREYNEEEKQGVFYAESWALVHYMMFDTEKRRTQFNEFLSDIAVGRPAPQAFQEVFGTELSAFQKVFEAYIQQRMAWNAMELPTPAGLDRSKDMTARVMTEAETEFQLGDLLLHLDRAPEAESHLAKAIQLDAKLGSAQASMGRLLLSKGNEAEAVASLKRATELDPGNYLTHFYYASAVHDKKPAPSETDWATIRTELQKTIQIAPQFVEATERLADANLLRNTDIAETIDLLVKAITVAPGNDRLVVQLAFAISRTQQRETARPLVRSVLAKPTLDPVVRRNAQTLMDFLDRAANAEVANRALAQQRPAAAAARGLPTRTITEEEALTAGRDGTAIVTSEVTIPHREIDAGEAGNVSIESAPKPKLPDGTERILGLLTQLDCRNGVTISLVAGGKTVKLHTSTPGEIKFTSFNSAVSGSISCGPAPGTGVPAGILYRPRVSGDSIGEPIAIDFIDPADLTPSK